MTMSRTISIIVKKKTGEAFDAILEIPPKLMPDAKMNDDGWWFFTGPHGKSRLKFNENKSLGILDHLYIDENSSWDVPMRVVSSGDFSEIIMTLNKPDELNDDQFEQRVAEIGEMIITMKNIIESNS
ncbi:MAG: hypothetical protein QQN49_01280 [Nitrosopumilus sp.]